MFLDLTELFDLKRDVSAYDAVQERRDADEQVNDLQAFERQRSGVAADTGEMARDTMAANASVREGDAKKEEQRRKDAFETQALLNQINLQDLAEYADQRGRDAANLEKDLEDMFGADWRQDVALRVFGPDEFPHKREDETPEEYEQRLEDELIDRMIDPKTGEIRDEYKSDPELAKAAEWAKARYDERRARAEIERQKDPTLSVEEKERSANEFVKTTSFNQQRQAVQEAALAQSLEGLETIREVLAEETNDTFDKKTSNGDTLTTETSGMDLLRPPGA